MDSKGAFGIAIEKDRVSAALGRDHDLNRNSKGKSTVSACN